MKKPTLIERLDAVRPRCPAQLASFVERVLGLRVPDRPVIEGNRSPMDYLSHAFFERGDCVVWASRGGGKTMLGAVATLLDMLFKPGIQVRVLGGSLEQSSRMHRYLLGLVSLKVVRPFLFDEPTQRRVTLFNGSSVEVLAQSERAVRGLRVHKLRCDEVELFDRAVWRAAQLVTRSGLCGNVFVRGSIETLSTMHQPFGLMSELTSPGRGVTVFRWCAIDVAERCPSERDCQACNLWKDCGGRA
ncbi:MAG: hypothetical protein GC164_02710 [Phycisphaera sp.]|nr:hypothetical protein [Phycisphaera sp.]